MSDVRARLSPAGRQMLALLVCSSATAAEPTELRTIIEEGRLDGLRWPRFPDYQAGLAQLYADGGWTQLWMSGEGPTNGARIALEELRRAGDRGLNAPDYDA